MSVIRVDNLKKHFGKVTAIDGISFDVKEGEIFGDLGPTGAGKTTTIRCLMDFIRPDSGEVDILGKDAQKDSVELKESIGFLSDDVHLYEKWTSKTHINFIRKLNGKNDIADELVKLLELDVNRKVKSLSSGNKQKLGVVLAFMFEPKVLILDEPTRSLDPLLQNEVYRLIEKRAKAGTTVFMSSHNLAEVDRICSRVGIIKGGKMVAVEDIAELKEKRIYTVRVDFDHGYKKSDFEDENIEIRDELAKGLVLGVKGDIDLLVRKLAKYDIKFLKVEQASLEEIFLEYYE